MVRAQGQSAVPFLICAVMILSPDDSVKTGGCFSSIKFVKISAISVKSVLGLIYLLIGRFFASFVCLV